MKDMQKLPGADTDSDHKLLVVKICTRLKKIIRFQKRRQKWDLEILYAQLQRMQHTLEEKVSAIGCDSGNVVVQWNNIFEVHEDKKLGWKETQGIQNISIEDSQGNRIVEQS